jgi:hypothetical protein
MRFPGGRVVIAIEPSGTPRAQVSGRHLSLAYRVEGSLAPQDGAAMRDRMRAIAETFMGAESSPPLPERFLSDPSLLIEPVDRLRRAEIHEAHPIAPSNLPPCMDTAVRPETPQRPLARVATPIVAPCDECGAALCCPSNARPRPAPARPLRVLRHGDAAEATLAAITAVAGAWKQPVPGVALEVLSVLFGARAGVLGVPAAPFELSLKRSASSLLPRLRLVEYSPRSRAGLPSREERAPRRRDRLVALAESLGATEARSWVELLEGEQPPGMELSFGIDADLGPVERGKALPQLYAHIEPRDRNGMLTTLRRVLEWSGAKPSEVEPFASLVRGYDGGDRSELVLVALAPGEGRARRTKVYFGRQLEKGHGPSGLQPADTGSLRSFASNRGLAVLACDSETPSWEKWDFPCAVHFQLAAGLPSAFAEGLGEEDRARVATLFDGRRFAPWPTWLSVGNAASTLYFVPR